MLWRVCHSKEGGAQKSLLLIRVSYSKNCSNKCLYTKSLISLLPQPTKTKLLLELFFPCFPFLTTWKRLQLRKQHSELTDKPLYDFDGIALGIQIKKVKEFKDKMQFILGRESATKLSGTTFQDRSFIKLKSNKDLLKECAKNQVWPMKDKDYLAPKADPGMQCFWQMIEKQDTTAPVPEGLLLLMSNLSTSTSTTNLFQVRI